MSRLLTAWTGLLICVGSLLTGSSALQAAEIRGEYLEARTCDIYTGPCFANGEIGLTGREAVLAWKVDAGTWNKQDLSGMCAALVVYANDTLAIGGSFYSNPDHVRSVILVDAKATSEQQAALVEFVKASAPNLSGEVIKVQPAPLALKNDHVSGKGVFDAGTLARIETRKLKGGDCVCSNEAVIYPPLAAGIENSHAAYTLNMTFNGKGLDRTWTTINKRSAFLGTFSKTSG